MVAKCCVQTPVRTEICPPGVDCEGNKIVDMYGFEGRYRPLGDCPWTHLPTILYPQRHFDFQIDADGEYEFQWRSLRHGVKFAGGTSVYSTVPGPWSDSVIFSASVAPPIKGEPAKIVLAPGSVC